ncbi:PfkB family carbohydrate kinase [Demequina sp. B12]|uniref:PfkB family carbohydrate kinase n=1 Tax=Demequina sp. B12 TaxID=2992757 RepID=UPI00237C0A63|nr:PfkB family carbohydrate kinase [Demequina sp. B12]MDE0573685.1 PfkB family carbohydrate kinase [Demequina sp. B12]
MPGPVVVVGSANVDRVVSVARPPQVGETLLGEHAGRFAGGKGLNQAIAAAKSAAPTVLCAAVGADADGDLLQQAVSAAGVEGALVRAADAATGVAHILSFPDGDNSIVVAQGANGKLSVADARAAVAGASVVVVPLEVPLEVAGAALEAGQASGAVTVLNAAPAHAEALGLVRHASVVVVNESECEALGGAAALVAAGVQDVIVTLGARGAAWHRRHHMESFPAFPIVPVDTTGAGDAFCGALAAALWAGEPMPEAIRRGSAAGALTALSAGANTADIGPEAVAALMERGD